MRPRPRGLIWLAILAWLAAASAWAAGLPAAVDFAADARLMREKRLPMLVFFDRPGCPWCEKARREWIAPMVTEAADPAAPVLVRQVEVNRDAPLRDFAGRTTSHRAFARSHGVKLTPTLLFLGPDGEALAEPLVGYGNADFYGGLVANAIAASRDKLMAKDAK